MSSAGVGVVVVVAAAAVAAAAAVVVVVVVVGEVDYCFGGIQDMGSAGESVIASWAACLGLVEAMCPYYLLVVEVSLMVLGGWFDIQGC
jgi:hypothetical protein